MKTFVCIMVMLFSFAATWAISYLSLKYAWGLEVKSWPIFFGCIVMAMVNSFITLFAGAALNSKD